jgi:NAD(P)-dependent dehydrogenase (short-subunit alcohol dehydrogenase family)
MTARNWLITGVSSGFGRELATQLLDRGDIVVGTVRRADSVADLVQKYPDTFRRELLDVTDAAAIRDVVDRSFTSLGRIDVVVSNAGYGLFGAAEELSDDQVTHIIATNLTGSIQLIRAALPQLRAQGSGRIIQMSTYGGQVAFPGNSMYHATKWGIEGFAESVAQEVVPFGIGVTIVEPGGARTEIPLRQRPGRRPPARLRRHPGARLPGHARPGQRARPRRPGPDGRRHHRQRRPAARPAAHHPRIAGPADHHRGPQGPHRRL